MAKSLKYLPWFVRDWWTDPKVRGCSWVERSVYRDMLELSWETGALQNDPARLYRACGLEAPAAVETVKFVLSAFWSLGEAGWTNPRLEKERAWAEAIRQKQSEGAIAANTKRWSVSKRSVTDSVTESVPDPKPQVQDQDQVQREDSDASHRAMSPRKRVAPRKSPSEKKLPSPESELRRGLLAAWEALWDERYDEPYAFVGGKDGSALKRIVGYCRGNPEPALERMRILLSHPPDDWYATHGTLAVLASKWNELGLAQANGKHEENGR
jgi:uncharacterized protein YdaU (DUF1376 family)